MLLEHFTELLGDSAVRRFVDCLEAQTEGRSGVGGAGVQPTDGEYDSGPISSICLRRRMALRKPVTDLLRHPSLGVVRARQT